MRHSLKAFTALTMVLVSSQMVTSAYAADKEATVEDRVYRLEKEMKAVQRKVFPGGAPIEPDLTAPAATQAVPPSSTPVTDLISRVTALEGQLATLTGQVEQNSYKLRQLEKKLDQMAAAAEPVVTEDGVSAPASTGAPAPSVSSDASEQRKAAVAAIELPDTGDVASDSYVYGYRLWDAKFYPEAQVQLKATVDKHGSTVIGSRAQNLLGRAYLDDGKPALASVNFYENYQKRPDGDRASQSLAYLGEALIQLKKPADACKVYGELEQRYGEGLSAGLRSMMEKGRARAKCGG
ncbi:MAG: hypothetical protein R3E11_03895 [Sphingobium sp.]|nr:hypothetical protein [Sphingobium sp.]MCP5398637.1 hypothetical protein [Sphingomonas sp.]